MTLWEFFHRNQSEVLSLTLEHLYLVGLSIALAVGVGVPVGVLLTRKAWLAKPLLGFANVMQTVPSLALFGFLIPLNIYLFHVRVIGGIGARTAVAALVLYALLPIIRNTYTGIRGVDPAVREAGRGMGLTDRQLLFQVEIPLSLGVIIAGIRVATVIAVGTATIAAAIDAGGLGRYIFRGLRMNDNVLILAGAVPAAVMALVADLLLGGLERALGSGALRRAGARRVAWASAAAALILGAGLALAVATSRNAGQISVGSKDFTEQILLGELLAQVIESETGLSVERRFDLGGNLAHQALLAGEIDGYVEYTGTALTAILHHPPLSDPKAVYERVKEDYAKEFDLVWSEPLGFDNTFAILIRGEEARRLNLKTVSEAASYAPRWTAGFGQDFMSRPDGYPGFSRAYRLKFAGIREMDLSLTYRALAERQVDLIAGNSTDGLIARYNLAQLQDDRGYFPPYDAVPVVRKETLRRHPRLESVLRSLGGLISVQEMRQLNYQVDGEHRPVPDVVRDFLRRKRTGAGP